MKSQCPWLLWWPNNWSPWGALSNFRSLPLIPTHKWGGAGLGTGKQAEWLTSWSLPLACRLWWISDGELGNRGGWWEDQAGYHAVGITSSSLIDQGLRPVEKQVLANSPPCAWAGRLLIECAARLVLLMMARVGPGCTPQLRSAPQVPAVPAVPA